MTREDRISKALEAANGPLCDDCLSLRAEIHPRQQVNKLCNELGAAQKVVRSRDVCVACQKLKLSSTSRFVDGHVRPPAVDRGSITSVTPPVTEQIMATREAVVRAANGVPDRAWHWEGRVQSALAKHLLGEGWDIRAVADTETKEQGPDLVVTKGARTLFVEVKGYPTNTYEHGANRGELKPTQPTNQARQWFSHAALKIMLLRSDHPEAEVAACFPDFPTYRNLAGRTRRSFETLGVGLFFIRNDATVELFVPHAQALPRS